jgi:ATP-dependent HslUV protease subunit HslV
MDRFHSTTIVAVKKGDSAAIAGDGQVTMGDKVILKHSAKKIRRLNQGDILAGFAGSVADAFILFDMFESNVEKHHGNLLRAAVEVAKAWRSDRILRQLDALLLVVNKQHMLIVSGNGEVIEPDDGIAAIGSGAPYALAAARAFCQSQEMSAREICEKSLNIAADICVFTNHNIVVEEL